MSQVQLTLTAEESEWLVRTLDAALGDKRVEVRRTEFSAQFRSELEKEERLIAGLLARLSQTTPA